VGNVSFNTLTLDVDVDVRRYAAPSHGMDSPLFSGFADSRARSSIELRALINEIHWDPLSNDNMSVKDWPGT